MGVEPHLSGRGCDVPGTGTGEDDAWGAGAPTHGDHHGSQPSGDAEPPPPAGRGHVGAGEGRRYHGRRRGGDPEATEVAARPGLSTLDDVVVDPGLDTAREVITETNDRVREQDVKCGEVPAELEPRVALELYLAWGCRRWWLRRDHEAGQIRESADVAEKRDVKWSWP